MTNLVAPWLTHMECTVSWVLLGGGYLGCMVFMPAFASELIC